jgi:hypothetical protein
MKLIQIDMKFLRDLDPCYDPIKYLPEDFRGTALDILNHKEIPAKDKLWVCLRTYVLDEKTLRLFSVKCARYATNLLTDKAFAAKLNDLIDVSEKYALGLATEEERIASRIAANIAVYSADHSAACEAARSVAHSAADLVAYSIGNSAAYLTALSAALSASSIAGHLTKIWFAHNIAVEFLVELISAKNCSI